MTSSIPSENWFPLSAGRYHLTLRIFCMPRRGNFRELNETSCCYWSFCTRGGSCFGPKVLHSWLPETPGYPTPRGLHYLFFPYIFLVPCDTSPAHPAHLQPACLWPEQLQGQRGLSAGEASRGSSTLRPGHTPALVCVLPPWTLLEPASHTPALGNLGLSPSLCTQTRPRIVPAATPKSPL